MTMTSACLPRHIVSNILISGRPAEKNVADVKSHLLFYEVKPEGFNFKTSGIYTDVVEKVNGSWKFRCNAKCCILKLEAMTEDEVVPLGSVLAKVLIELCWGLGLDMTDFGAKTVSNTSKPLVSSSIP